MTAAAALLGTALVALATAASPSPDLSVYLAPAPASNWVESGPGATVLSGPFTAADYGRYSTAINGTPSAAGANLESAGFIRGYGREWEQRVTHDYLVERVFSFGDAAHASSWYYGVKTQSETDSRYDRDIPGASDIPNSFGVVLNQPSGYKQWRLDFLVSNLVFVIHADAARDDMTSVAIGQAKATHDLATGVRPPASHPASAPPSWLIPAVVGFAVFAVLLTAGVIAAVIIATRPRRVPSLQMSPDGAYWWDGAQWRSSATDPPPGVRPPGT